MMTGAVTIGVVMSGVVTGAMTMITGTDTSAKSAKAFWVNFSISDARLLAVGHSWPGPPQEDLAVPSLRDTILRLMPKNWRNSAIVDSKRWQTRCTKCQSRSTVWDLGGMRWKAYGEPLTGFRCPVCNTFTMHKITRSKPEPEEQD